MTRAGRHRLLIVNADDYGLTPGVSRGILEGHRRGIVTSTSVLVLAPAFAEAAPWLADHPELEVGVHLALVGEDPPVLAATEIPTLVDGTGRLHRSWARLLPRLAVGQVDPADVGRELDAQLEVARSHGIDPGHVDLHQNLQLWPSVARAVIGLARRHRIGAVRVPGAAGRAPAALGVRALAPRLADDVRAAGLRFASRFEGFDDRGRLDRPALAAALARAAASGAPSVEVGGHPGGSGPDPERARYRWGYRWGDELAALVDPAIRDLVDELGFRLGTHHDLADLAGPAATR